ncbi:adenosine kinase [uncultured Cohaesibacter sp.]|uniref:adenosine kinase n=1 Tax=uncultured Cohaesibacter sp. TaxID=1002546 RepID=UPI0029C83E37|nr:adenosine kinase [uncultured Cohaesibacter sp.]
MTKARFDVLGIGNAIVDVLARTEDDFLVAEGLHKGSMNLIDTERAEYLYKLMGPAIEASGGSAGNTVFGLASLGADTAFFGKVADDQLGEIFSHDMRSLGAHFDCAPLVGGVPTARSMILISPDGERTMNTYLGAATELSEADIDEDIVANAAITYMEGYLWDKEKRQKKPSARRPAFRTKPGGRFPSAFRTASALIRFREEFLDLLQTGQVDIVFANEPEVKALYQTADRATALNALRADTRLSAVTLGGEGSVAISGNETFHVPACNVRELVDTTGAGDLYAAGFLYGITHDMDLEKSATLGNFCAAEVIQHIGPRPEHDMRQAAEQAGLL